MKEQEWLNANFALLLMDWADSYARDDDDNSTSCEWRRVAARAACLKRLGSETPEGVRAWLGRATTYLDREDRTANADDVLYEDRDSVYRAFREAYLGADAELRQRLAAGQDVFRGQDYYAEEGYLLEEDEDSATYIGPVYKAESIAHCDIIRDIFGNPFRPVIIDSSWLTWNGGTIRQLAESIYTERAFDRIPILADALEDANCTDTAILYHLRGPGPHIRGCWVVDLLLGMS
jgi:hypothetical protein